MLLNEEKEKSNKLTQHLNNSNRNAAESKRKLAKLELNENKETKIKEEYELKLAKCRDMLRKKEELLTKAHARIEDFEKNYANIAQIEAELKELREKMIHMKNREDGLAKENETLKNELEDQKQQMQVKDETILFSQEHLRRLREEYEELEYDQFKEQEESRQLQI